MQKRGAVRILEMLGRRQGTLVTREKDLLGDLREFLAEFEASPADLNVVRQAEQALEELFLIVVVGERGPRKALFIDALVGEPACGEPPRDGRLLLLRHGEEAADRAAEGGVLERRRPIDYLREVSVLDAPPVNGEEQHARLVRYFLPAADLVLFLTPAGRPVDDHGHMFLQQARRWARKVVVVADRAGYDDSKAPGPLRSATERRAREALDAAPPTFLVSTDLAGRASEAEDGEERRHLLRASGLPELEAHITGVLDEEDRLRLKLESALNPIERLHIRYQFAIDERLGLIDGDLKAFEAARAQLEFFEEDMKRDFVSRMEQIEAVVSRMGTRGDAWFEKNVRLGRAVELTRAERVRDRFREEVVAAAEKHLDARMNELVDWMVERNLKQWRSMVDYVEGRRQAAYDEEMLGEIGDGFRYDRERALLSLCEQAAGVVRDFDREREAEQIALSLRSAASRTVLAEAGALGLAGGAVASSSFAAALALTMSLGTLLLGGLGLLMLPTRRRELGEGFRTNNEALRRRLGETLREQFLAELERSTLRLEAAISRYGDFIGAERSRMEGARDALEGIYEEAAALRHEIALPGVRRGGGA